MSQPTIFQHEYALDPASLQRSIVNLGRSSASLIAKLANRQPITVGVLGASVSLNGGCDQQPSRRCIEFDGKHMKLCHWGEPRTRPFKGFYVNFMERINATWPHAQHRLNNSAADTTPPQNFLDYCFFSHLPMPLDLVFLEFGSMAASATFAGVEAIVRVLLSLKSPPAIAFLTVREWCKASVKPWGSAPPYGPSEHTKHSKAEMAYTQLCKHYDQTCLSYHEAIAPHFFAKRQNFSMADIAGDCLHPNRGRFGNDYMTDILVHFLAVLARPEGSVSGGFGRPRGLVLPESLPEPLFDAARVKSDEERARNERCYGFGALGGMQRQRYQRLLSVPWATAYCATDRFTSIEAWRASCTHVNAEPECPSGRHSVAAWVRGGFSHGLSVWAFCRSATLPSAATSEKLGALKPTKRSPGVIATSPGATLFLTLDTRLADFASASPPNGRRRLRASLQYFAASNGLMGTVSLRCVPSTGCTCEETHLDANHLLGSSGSGTVEGLNTHLFDVFGSSATCMLIIRVLNQTSSQGHAFKLRQLTLTDERTATLSSSAGAHSTSTSVVGGASAPSSNVVRNRRVKHERVGKKQREMIKGSY